MSRDQYRQAHYTAKMREEIVEMHTAGFTPEEIIDRIEGPDCPRIYAEAAVQAVLELGL